MHNGVEVNFRGGRFAIRIDSNRFGQRIDSADRIEINLFRFALLLYLRRYRFLTSVTVLVDSSLPLVSSVSDYKIVTSKSTPVSPTTSGTSLTKTYGLSSAVHFAGAIAVR